MRTHIKFGLNISEIDFELKLNDIRPFDHFPMPPGTGPNNKMLLQALFMRVIHSPIGWISSNALAKSIGRL